MQPQESGCGCGQPRRSASLLTAGFLGTYMRMRITTKSRIIPTGTIRMSKGLCGRPPNIMGRCSHTPGCCAATSYALRQCDLPPEVPVVEPAKDDLGEVVGVPARRCVPRTGAAGHRTEITQADAPRPRLPVLSGFVPAAACRRP